MKNINKIITETLNRYLKENIYNETEQEPKKDDTPKGHSKRNTDDQLLAQLKSDAYNEAAIAYKLYPNHTQEGAQSEYRKKLHNEKNENGHVYEFTPEEMNKLREIIGQML